MVNWLAGMGGLLLLLTGGATDAPSGTTQTLNPPAVQPAQSRPIGGVQLDLEPRGAQVFVDGAYAGLVDDFRGYYQHLALPAGRHGIEVLTPGYVPLIFDVTVVPDRTITYRRSLEEAPRGW
jgi:PEGA domain